MDGGRNDGRWTVDGGCSMGGRWVDGGWTVGGWIRARTDGRMEDGK